MKHIITIAACVSGLFTTLPAFAQKQTVQIDQTNFVAGACERGITEKIDDYIMSAWQNDVYRVLTNKPAKSSDIRILQRGPCNCKVSSSVTPVWNTYSRKYDNRTTTIEKCTVGVTFELKAP
ncbi:MAG: hypothetical protein QM667_04260 [Asticcacaulis sp.]